MSNKGCKKILNFFKLKNSWICHVKPLAYCKSIQHWRTHSQCQSKHYLIYTMHTQVGTRKRHKEAEQYEKKPCALVLLESYVLWDHGLIKGEYSKAVTRWISKILWTEPLPFMYLIPWPDGSTLLISEFHKSNSVQSK